MFNQKEKEILIDLLQAEWESAWKIADEETEYIETLGELQSKIEDLECPNCLACNDEGKVWTTTEIDGRDIDNYVDCNCK